MELAKKPSDFFWQPSDPALLLHGDDVVPALRYGGDGLYRADGTLACRTSDRLVTQVAAPAGAVAGSPALTLDKAVFSGFGPGATTSVLDLPSGMDDLIAALVLESLLLWPDWAAAKAAEKLGQDPAPWLRWLTTQQDAFLAGGGTVASPYDGVPPSPVGTDAWDGNPWLPIMMHWEIAYWPAQQTPHDDPKQVFDPKLIVGRLHEENDSLDTDGVELVLAGDAPATQTTYSGITFITPHAGFAAVKQLQKYAQDNASSDSALVKLAANVKPVPLLSQALNGFHDRFLLRRKTPQVAVRDPFAQDAAFVKRVAGCRGAGQPRAHRGAHRGGQLLPGARGPASAHAAAAGRRVRTIPGIFLRGGPARADAVAFRLPGAHVRDADAGAGLHAAAHFATGAAGIPLAGGGRQQRRHRQPFVSVADLRLAGAQLSRR